MICIAPHPSVLDWTIDISLHCLHPILCDFFDNQDLIQMGSQLENFSQLIEKAWINICEGNRMSLVNIFFLWNEVSFAPPSRSEATGGRSFMPAKVLRHTLSRLMLTLKDLFLYFFYCNFLHVFVWLFVKTACILQIVASGLPSFMCSHLAFVNITLKTARPILAVPGSHVAIPLHWHFRRWQLCTKCASRWQWNNETWLILWMPPTVPERGTLLFFCTKCFKGNH